MMDKLSLLEIPLFLGLDRISRAKILPELEDVRFKAGETVFSQGDYGDSLYIVAEGTAKVVLGGGKEVVLRQKDCFGEMALLIGEPRSATVQAVTDLSLLRITRDSFETLLSKHHSLAIYFTDLLAKRLAATQRGQPESGISSETAESVREGMGLRQAMPVEQSKNRLQIDNRAVGVIGVFLCGAIFFYLKAKGASLSHIALLEILCGTTFLWSFSKASPGVIALAMPVLAVLLQAADPKTVLSGFSSPSWFLMLGIGGISAAIFKTGLAYRFSLWIIERFPSSYVGQTLALALAGAAMTPLLPSAATRTRLVSSLLVDLCGSMRIKSATSGTAGLAMASLLGFSHMSFMFLNGTGVTLLAYGLMPPEARGSVTYGVWFLAALPAAVVFFTLSYLAVLRLYPTQEKMVIDPGVIEAQHRELGPLTREEKISILALTVMMLGFMTESLHHAGAAWVTLTSLLILWGGSVLDDKSIRSDIDWSVLISMGAFMGFAGALAESGLPALISEHAKPYFQFFMGSRVLFLVVIMALMMAARFLLPIIACIVVTVLAALPLAAAAGIHPLVIAIVAALSTNPWFFPYQNSMYETLRKNTEGRLFKHEQNLECAKFYAIACLAAMLVSIPFWKYLGYL